MESGSLLMEALHHMKQLHEMQDLYSSETPSSDGINPIDITNGYPNINHAMNHNSLFISLYLIDPHEDDAPQNFQENIKILLQKLSSLHSILHDKMIPLYNKRYQHCWFTGGEGLSFGIHCKDIHDHSDVNDPKNSIPHLRALVRYGSNIMDEYYALAMMYSLSRDLYKHHGIKTAIECWDIDDGHILLIEGANALPSWVDDEVGVKGMNKRVYVVNGHLVLIPPSWTEMERTSTMTSTYTLNRQTALRFLATECSFAYKNSSDCMYTDARLDGAIESRLGPFRQVLDNITNMIDQRKILKEYVHRASIVLPLRLALMVQDSPGLILPIAIASFCRYCRDSGSKKSSSSSSSDYANIPFENLVVTTISIPKTLYAMLLTGAGQYPPPLKIPLNYKSIEMKRMKRKFSNGGEGFSHFRHALEAGMRLSLGYEWTMVEPNAQVESNTSSTQIKSHDLEERLGKFYPRLVQEAGGNPDWIFSAWNQGPNNTANEDDIACLVKCPVWDPEIMNGGLYPLTKPGKSCHQLISDVFNRSVKQEQSSSCDLYQRFPMPKASDVDSDDWIDFHSIDELEAKMSDITTSDVTSTRRLEDSDKIVQKNTLTDDEKMMKMNNLFETFDNFIGKESDVGGIYTKKDKSNEGSMDINSSAYLFILRKALKLKANEQLNLDDLSADELKDKELLSFFSEKDLDMDTDSDQSIEEDYDSSPFNETSNMTIKDLMVSCCIKLYFLNFCQHKAYVLFFPRQMKMDEELEIAAADRTYSNEDAQLRNLPLNDPAVMKANAISNLIQSLDSQEGTLGPISTILREANEE